MRQEFNDLEPHAGTGPPQSTKAGTLALDPERYRHHLEAFEMTPEQENELLRTLWELTIAFVDLGWGVDSIHNIFAQMVDKSLNSAENHVESKGKSKKKGIESAAKMARKESL